jgi:hypothetical protein
MNTLEKIQALREGGWIKACLEGTEWIREAREVFCDADLGKPLPGKCSHEHALYNAAKVEVTKGVLDGVIEKLESTVIVTGRQQQAKEALTLLKTLREAL